VCRHLGGRWHGWARGARCKYVLVSSASASMRWRAPQSHPCQRLHRVSVCNEDQRPALLCSFSPCCGAEFGRVGCLGLLSW